MKKIRLRLRLLVRGVAVLLVFLSATAAYFWFYMLAPFRRTQDMEWCRRHSAEAYWEEIQTGIRRFQWGHDDPVGLYADARFMAWAMARTKTGDDISSCAAGHRDGDFRQLTNQDAGNDAEGWLLWWQGNGTKTQEEWIQEGFAIHGIFVTIPPSEADVEPLLALLGTEPAEGYLKYNAFRWLRDSDFHPVEYAISHGNDAMEPTLRSGLLEYYRLERNYPKRDRVGRLGFGRMQDRPRGPPPGFLSTRFKFAVVGLVFGFPCLSVGMLVWSLGKPKSASPGMG